MSNVESSNLTPRQVTKILMMFFVRLRRDMTQPAAENDDNQETKTSKFSPNFQEVFSEFQKFSKKCQEILPEIPRNASSTSKKFSQNFQEILP